MKLLLMMIPARVWVIKTCHEQIFGVSLSTEELQLLNILQTFFVLIISTEPNAIELLYPVLNNSLIALAQDFVPIATFRDDDETCR